MSQDLPAFVVLTSVSKGTSCGQIFYDFYWGSGFLPSRYQGVKFRGSSEPVLYLSDPDGLDRPTRRAMLDDIAALNELRFRAHGDPEIATRMTQYEMAFRMQTSVPELTDLSREPQSVLDLYGPSVREKGTYAYNCLMARRLVERGVRCVQVMHAGWDQHNSLTTELYTQCKDTDQPSAGLVADLKQRGLLDDTLVVWGGEFGRTPLHPGQPRGSTPMGPRSPSLRLHSLAGGRRHATRPDPRGHGRPRHERGRGSRPRPRPASHAAAPPGNRPRATDVPIPRPGFPFDRHSRKRRP
jgi:hypothetical protein